jgi:methylglutaconyl-CoA hydratase
MMPRNRNPEQPQHRMRAASSMSFEQAIAFLEGQIVTLALTEDAREGRQAFIEKRQPNWSGR